MKEKLHQQEMEELVLRLNAVIETAIDGIITIDKKGIIESVNSAAANLFGYEKRELVGQNIKILMDSPHKERHDGYVSNYIKTRQAKIIGIGREVYGIKKNRKIFPLRLAVNEIKLKDRIIFTGIIHDLTEVKKAEEHIKKLNEELEQKVKSRTEELALTINKLLTANKLLEHEVSERKNVEKALRKSEKELTKALEKEKELSEMKTRFLTIASHEFRTPLSTILSSADLIEAYTESPQQVNRLKHTQRIKVAVDNLNTILNDFLSLSRLDEKKIEVRFVDFSLTDLTDEVIDQVQGLLKPKQQIVYINETKNENIFLDKQILKNILLNLLSNAIKYSREGKVISCVSTIGQESLQIVVKDEGIGIPLQDQVHLFTRFFRAKNVENTKGTGLGLNIVRKYVDLMDGTIEFVSKEGKGSTFTIKIPLIS